MVDNERVCLLYKHIAPISHIGAGHRLIVHCTRVVHVAGRWTWEEAQMVEEGRARGDTAPMKKTTLYPA